MTDYCEVVISGVGGAFPHANNIKEFGDILLKNEHISDDAIWTPGELDVCHKIAKIERSPVFDATFFGVHRKQSVFLDPMQRMVLEGAYEAIIDAGVNPIEIRGKKVGVFFGSTISENDCYMFETNENGFAVIGQSRSMFANRVSYCFNLVGPSCSFDSTWTSGIQVIQLAVEAIRRGQCDSALVGSCNLTRNASLSWMLKEMGLLSEDAFTKAFDSEATGYSRSDGVVVFYLTRADIARRTYATVLFTHAVFNGSHKGNILDMDPEGIENFLAECYQKSGINPNDVQYLETYGCGVKKYDENELNAIENYFFKTRKEPLKIGTVKSNFGHAEGAAAMMSILKVLVAMETGIIPATIHYKNPNPNIPSLSNGHLQVVTKNTEWNGGIAAVNALGLSCSYGHILLRSNPKLKLKIELELPLLTCFSTRSEEGIKTLIEKVEANSKDLEFSHLAHNVFSTSIPLHLYRGYTMKGNENKNGFLHFTGNKRPIWFVYSGMGSQWPTMGKDLMGLPIFKASIEKCHKILEPKGIDLKNILIADEEDMFDNILHSFVGIAAIQIGLTDVLRSLGIVPDGIIGHSVGELGCAYADECLTAEQMILCAYSRGKASVETELITGLMAAIGLGYKQIKDLVPPSIEVACHNGPDSCTISGPVDDMKQFVSILQDKGIFARLVNVSNIAYHSRYIKPAAPKLLELLKEVVPIPVQRSNKWISTSVRDIDWQSDLAKTSSAEYHTNNLLSSVLFEEGLSYIPQNAVLIEIAPHGLLQAILKRSLHTSCTNVALTKRKCNNGLDFLFNSLGQLYASGVDMNLVSLYPSVSHPVSNGTGSLAELILWEHREDWSLGLPKCMRFATNEKNYTITLNKKEFRHLTNNKLDGKIFIPATVYLGFLTEVLLQTKSAASIVFENVTIKKNIHISEAGSVEVSLTLLDGTGHFEVNDFNSVIMSGRINVMENYDKEISQVPKSEILNTYVDINGEDFYKVLSHRGYDLSDEFKSVKVIRKLEGGVNAIINWKDDWQTFLNGMFQLFIFRDGEVHQDILVPSFIRKLAISFDKLPKRNQELEVTYNYDTGILNTAGIQICGLSTEKIPKEKRTITVDENKFIKFQNEEFENLTQAIKIGMQIVMENTQNSSDFQVLEFKNSKQNSIVSQKDFENIANIKPTINTIDDSKMVISTPALITANENYYKDALSLFKNTGEFLLLVIPDKCKINTEKNLIVVLKLKVQHMVIYLLKKAFNIQPKVLNIENEQYGYEDINNILQTWRIDTKINNGQKVILTFKYLPMEGIKSFIRQIRLNPHNDKIRFIFILDKKAPECLPIEMFYQKIFKQDLISAVLKNGYWGTYVTIKNDELNHKQPIVNNMLATTALSNANPKCKISCLGLNVINIATEDVEFESQNEVRHVDYIGSNAEGQNIMGLARTESNGIKMIPDPNFIWTVPDKWTTMDAATVPYAYIMAYYTLFEVAQLKRGETVFINAGCTTFAQACIVVASCFGCPVYVTVETDQQKAYLQDIVPKLNADNILSSKDCGFENELKILTKGEGAHVIINCLSGDRFQAAKQCLASYGRFVQLGRAVSDKYDTTGMNCFLRCCTMFGVDPENIFQKSVIVKQKIHKLLQNGIDTGVVRPLERIIYEKNVDKIILRNLRSPECMTSAVFNVDNNELSKQKSDILNINKNGTYMIYGNITEDLVDIAEWVMMQGIQKLIIATTSKFQNYYVTNRLALMDHYYDVQSFLIMKSAETVEKTKDLILDAETYGNLISIFIVPDKNNIGTEFDFNVARNFDLALSQINPKVPLVCFLGSNTERTVVRMNSMPVYNIKWLDSCSFVEVLNILDPILKDMEYADIEVKNSQNIVLKNIVQRDIFTTLPDSLQTLKEIGNSLQNEIKIIQSVTKCPQTMKWVTPLFIVPGIFGPSSQHIKKFMQKLMYPAYCVNLVEATLSEKSGKSIAQEIVKNYKQGPYNMVGVSWGGALCLEIVKHLEAMGKKVQLFLIDGVPDTLNALIEEGGKNIKERLLRKLLNINEDIEKYENINEILGTFLKISNESNINQKTIENALNIIETYIEAIQKYGPSGELINGQTTLFRPENSSRNDSCGLTKYCKQVRIKVINGDHYSMLEDAELCEYINENHIVS